MCSTSVRLPQCIQADEVFVVLTIADVTKNDDSSPMVIGLAAEIVLIVRIARASNNAGKVPAVCALAVRNLSSLLVPRDAGHVVLVE